ncbi:MAG: hypothetical protein QM769_01850 [Pseudoxanthomonas sp.]
MATQIMAANATDLKNTPLRNAFPRYHNTCDRCGVSVGYNLGPQHKCAAYRETAAGMFSYVFCRTCNDEVEKKQELEQESECRRAMVNHAAKYDAKFGAFVARWYGIRVTAPSKRRA